MKLHTAAILLLFCLGIFTVHTVKGSASGASTRKFRCVTPSPARLNIQNPVSYEKQQVNTTFKKSVGIQPMRKFRCVRLSPVRLNIRNLVSYEKQQVPINAIMFINAEGIKICVSANQTWVQAAMKRIDEKRTAKRK